MFNSFLNKSPPKNVTSRYSVDGSSESRVPQSWPHGPLIDSWGVDGTPRTACNPSSSSSSGKEQLQHGGTLLRQMVVGINYKLIWPTKMTRVMSHEQASSAESFLPTWLTLSWVKLSRRPLFKKGNDWSIVDLLLTTWIYSLIFQSVLWIWCYSQEIGKLAWDFVVI